MSGVSIELVGGPLDGLLTVAPWDRPQWEFLVPMPVSPAELLSLDPAELVPLRVGVYRRAQQLPGAGAAWTYRWVGEVR